MEGWRAGWRGGGRTKAQKDWCVDGRTDGWPNGSVDGWTNVHASGRKMTFHSPFSTAFRRT